MLENNGTMNQLSESLIDWKNKQTAEQEEVKKRFDQAKAVVLELRTEKTELREKVAQLEAEKEKLEKETAMVNFPVNDWNDIYY